MSIAPEIFSTDGGLAAVGAGLRDVQRGLDMVTNARTYIGEGTISGGVSGQIVAGSITSAEILAGTITALQIAAGTITASQIAAGTITATNILANTITAGQIAAGTITATQIAAGTITGTQISATAIDGKTITGATIQTSSSSSKVYMNSSGFFSDVSGTTMISILASGAATFKATTVDSGTFLGNYSGQAVMYMFRTSGPYVYRRTSAGGRTDQFAFIDAGGGGFFNTAFGACEYEVISDERLKTNIVPLDGQEALGKVISMQGVRHGWKADGGKKKDIGFIAQDVAKHFPEIAGNNSPEDEWWGVDYDRIVPVHNEAITELAKIVQDAVEFVAAELDAPAAARLRGKLNKRLPATLRK